MPIGATLVQAEVVTKGGPMDMTLYAASLPLLLPEGRPHDQATVESEDVAITLFNGPFGGSDGYPPMLIIQADLAIAQGEATVYGVLWTWSYELKSEPPNPDAPMLLALRDPV